MRAFMIMATMALAVQTAGPAKAADCVLPTEAQAGKRVSLLCKTCHVFEAGASSRSAGPNLHDVHGGVVAARKDFQYSDALRALAAKTVRWTDDALYDYLEDPKAFLVKETGANAVNKMAFVLRDTTKRRDVTAFLKAIKGKPECD